MLKKLNYHFENSLMGEGILTIPALVLDRILYYAFFKHFYAKKFKAYGNNIRWGRNFSRLVIPSSVRISCPELIEIGDDCRIDEHVFLQCFEKGDGIVLENQVRLNAHTHLLAHAKIILHSKVLVAPYALITSVNHGYRSDMAIMDQPMNATGTVEVGAGTWLGQNSKVFGNSFICDNSVVAAGAVVKGRFESRGIIAGVPAKLVRAI